jgi:hypothetical protein
MNTRTFIDAKQDERCKWDITLRDGSKAQCGRRAVFRPACLCTQHWNRRSLAALAASFPVKAA